MKTRIEKIIPDNIDMEAIEKMGDIIKNGGLVAFPTETVYGLGADCMNEEAVLSIFKAKGRPSDNPLIVHVADVEQVYEIAREVPDDALELFKHFSPGPITVIMKKKECVPEVVTAGLDTVAVRIPEHPVALELIKKSKAPIAAPSSNRSGKPSPTKAEHVIADMEGRIDAIIDGGECRVGVESTVIDVTGSVPTILRPGGITKEDIKKVLPDVVIDKHVLKSVEVDESPKCPGMKYKHYAPDAEVFVVEGNEGRVYEKITECITNEKNKRIGVISQNGREYNAELVLDAGRDNVEYANKLFDYLREFDKHDIDIVFAEFSIEDEHALAVKNRLYKSAANRVIRV